MQVHRLVQAVIRAQFTAAQAAQWQQAAAALTEAAIPDDGKPPDAWPACALLMPHARVTLGLIGDGIWQVAQSLGVSGSYTAARDLCALIADPHRDSEDYGPEHPETLIVRANLAHWTGEAGDAAGARDQFAALLPIRKGVQGPDHPDTLATYHELAHWSGQARMAFDAS